MSDERPYSRVYHEAQADDRFASVWKSDPNLALWLRLLVLADGAWPAPAAVPRSARKRPLAVLVHVGLVELINDGDLYRIHGMDAERGRRSKRAAHAADVRWHGPGNATGIAGGIASGNAGVMLDETRQDKTSITRASAMTNGHRPKPNSVDRDPSLREMREAQVERYGKGMDEPTPAGWKRVP